MCLGMSAPGTNMQETLPSDSREATAKSQGTPLRSLQQRAESPSSILSTRLPRRMNLIVSRALLSAMGHSAMFSSNGLLLKGTIEWFLLIMKIIQSSTLAQNFLASIKLNLLGYWGELLISQMSSSNKPLESLRLKFLLMIFQDCIILSKERMESADI